MTTKIFGKIQDLLTLMESANDVEYPLYAEWFNDILYAPQGVDSEVMTKIFSKLIEYGISNG